MFSTFNVTSIECSKPKMVSFFLTDWKERKRRSSKHCNWQDDEENKRSQETGTVFVSILSVWFFLVVSNNIYTHVAFLSLIQIFFIRYTQKHFIRKVEIAEQRDVLAAVLTMLTIHEGYFSLHRSTFHRKRPELTAFYTWLYSFANPVF